MPKTKIEICRDKLAKANCNISKFYDEHDIEEIKTNRYLYFQYTHRLKESERDSYLLSKKVNLDICKTANKLYYRIHRLKKKKEKLELELYNLSSANKTSPTSVFTTFFSTNLSSLQQNIIDKRPSNQRSDQTHLNDVTKTLFEKQILQQ